MRSAQGKISQFWRRNFSPFRLWKDFLTSSNFISQAGCVSACLPVSVFAQLQDCSLEKKKKEEEKKVREGMSKILPRFISFSMWRDTSLAGMRSCIPSPTSRRKILLNVFLCPRQKCPISDVEKIRLTGHTSNLLYSMHGIFDFLKSVTYVQYWILCGCQIMGGTYDCQPIIDCLVVTRYMVAGSEWH